MEDLYASVSLIVGKSGEVTMPDPGYIKIEHSNGQHWFKIFADVTRKGFYFLVDDQGMHCASHEEWLVVNTLRDLFR